MEKYNISLLNIQIKFRYDYKILISDNLNKL